MSKCTKCNHDCHCSGDLHADVYGTCACEKCECKSEIKKSEHVVDSTNDCEWCQQMPKPIKKWIVKLRMLYADIRGHHGRKWNYEPSEYYMGRKRKK